MTLRGLPTADQPVREWLRELDAACPPAGRLYAHALENPLVAACGASLARAYSAISEAFQRGGTLYLCGNGGSSSDAMHIAGELAKSFVRPRPLPKELYARLGDQPYGADLCQHLQMGMRAHVLGCNPALSSAVANDIALAGIGYAQELCALGRPGDVLLGISTSGHARNVLFAVSTAKALMMTSVGLTGPAGNPLATLVDIAMCVPANETYRVQEAHVAIYHQLCLMLEARFFPD